MKITFLGAAEGVTGSNYLVETTSAKFIVDCGLYQGGKENELLNWKAFGFNPSELDFAIATHSHIDHIGRFPKLAKEGFTGPIIATKPTTAFCKIFLEDACHLMENTAEYVGQSELYSLEDVAKVVSLLEGINYHEIKKIGDVEIQLYDAGHILGSSIVEIKADGKTVIFSGDLGNPPVPIIKDTEFIKAADAVVMESTYGDRIHEPYDTRRSRLQEIIANAEREKGVLLVPSFAMERTQEILYELNDLVDNKRIGQIPIYIDSPLAIKATEVYKQYSEYFDTEAKGLWNKGDNFFDFAGLKVTESSDESKALDMDPSMKMIIAGSGMSNGGRIVFHEKRFLPEPTTTLVVVGYQIEGTLGRKLKDGDKQVRIMGVDVEVQAKVEVIDAYSAHADKEKLKHWLGQFEKAPKKVFITHGEQPAKENLAREIKEDQGKDAIIPKPGETIQI